MHQTVSETMPSFFRLIHRARSRSQRRRFYAWLLLVTAILFLLLYSQQVIVLSYEKLPAGAELLDAQASAEAGAGSNRARRAPDMKLLNTIDETNKGRGPDGGKHINEFGEEESDEDGNVDLLPDLAPPLVHFIWCGKRTFEYRHFLSIKRADAVIKPDKIVFHHAGLPRIDHEGYYTWFNKTLAEHANIVLRKLNVTQCPDSGPERYMLALSLLENFGGIYVPEDALLVDFPVHLRAADLISGVVPKTPTQFLDGIIVAKKGGFISPSSQAGLIVVLSSGRSSPQGTLQPCGSIDHYSTVEEGDCICVKVEDEIFPSSVWYNKSNFASLARLAGYGTNEIKPKHSTRTTIPKIAHYICWDCELKFSTYLSIMSSLYVAGLSKVYIHGVKQPSGIWWQRLQATQRVIHVYREYPEHSLDRATMTQELAQGIMQVSILLKYGGVYCDSKVIWTSEIPEHYFGYDAVASPGFYQYGHWPDSVSHTTVMAKKNSEYLLKLRNIHAHNRKQVFWLVDQFLAYKIVEEHPEVLFLDRHFQVKCLNKHCHPSWQPGYKIPIGENPPGGPFNWQKDTLSVHWDVFPELELDTVKYTSGQEVEAARRALHRSGISIQELTSR